MQGMSTSTIATPTLRSWTIANLRVGFEQHSGRWMLREFASFNNLANVNYVRTVIVGDANGRYFEPSATRSSSSASAPMSPSDAPARYTRTASDATATGNASRSDHDQSPPCVAASGILAP